MRSYISRGYPKSSSRPIIGSVPLGCSTPPRRNRPAFELLRFACRRLYSWTGFSRTLKRSRKAEANLSNGQTVVADCVNPVEISRAAWKAVAARTESPLIQIEVVCTDRTEHRRRVETRKPDIPGHRLPTWETVVNYTYETWKADLVLDSFKLSTDEAVAEVLNKARHRFRKAGKWPRTFHPSNGWPSG